MGIFKMKVFTLALMSVCAQGLATVLSTNYPFCIEVPTKNGDKLFSKASMKVQYSVTGRMSKNIEFTAKQGGIVLFTQSDKSDDTVEITPTVSARETNTD